jgi:hypothetical protein
MRGSNIGAMKGAEAHGFQVDKQWISARDSRTRRIPEDEFDHVELDGVVVPFDQPFTSEGKKGEAVVAMQPGDITAPAGFTINCRCTVGFIPKRDANGRLIMKPKLNKPININTPQAQITNTIQVQNPTNILNPVTTTKSDLIKNISKLTGNGVNGLEKIDEDFLKGIYNSLKNEPYFKFDTIQVKDDRVSTMAASKAYQLFIGTGLNKADIVKSIGTQMFMDNRKNYSASGKLLRSLNIKNENITEKYVEYITDHELNHIKHYSVEFAAMGGWGNKIEKLSKSWLKKWDNYIENYDSDWIVSDYANAYKDNKSRSYEWLAESYLLYNKDKSLIKNPKIFKLLDDFDEIINLMRDVK